MNTVRFSFFSILVMVLIFFSACEKEVLEKETIIIAQEEKVFYENLNGSSQKGPFVIGSNITIHELDELYRQTGNSFTTEIISSTGKFSLNQIPLASPIIDIKCSGFYFNEVCGSNSVAPITLSCISSLDNSLSVNINLLTHLEKPRVKYLLAQGLEFDSAKAQAQKEVFAIFNVSRDSSLHSEYRDILQQGDHNAKLLAISVILQGLRHESELSTLLTKISLDLEQDGILNDVDVQSSLIDHALLLDTIAIRNNVESFAQNNGINTIISRFEKHLNQFLNTSSFNPSNGVYEYPKFVGSLPNVLNFSNNLITGNNRVTIAGLGRPCGYQKFLINRVNNPPGTNWFSTNLTELSNVTLDGSSNTSARTFIVRDIKNDFKVIAYFAPGDYNIYYYTENGWNNVLHRRITITL